MMNVNICKDYHCFRPDKNKKKVWCRVQIRAANVQNGDIRDTLYNSKQYCHRIVRYHLQRPHLCPHHHHHHDHHHHHHLLLLLL